MSAKSSQKYLADRSAEIARGWRESREGIEQLRSIWPAAFPMKSGLVKPLAVGTVAIVAERMGWKHWYARGVLRRWKERDVYCKAVLCYGQRFNLDGQPVGEIVDDRAKETARQQLARNAKRRIKNQERAARLNGSPEAAPAEAMPAIS
jgi:sRNA-binding protein